MKIQFIDEIEKELSQFAQGNITGQLLTDIEAEACQMQKELAKYFTEEDYPNGN